MLSHARLAAPAALKAGAGLGSRRRQTARAPRHQEDAVLRVPARSPTRPAGGGSVRVMDGDVLVVLIQTPSRLYHQSHAWNAGERVVQRLAGVPCRDQAGLAGI